MYFVVVGTSHETQKLPGSQKPRVSWSVSPRRRRVYIQKHGTYLHAKLVDDYPSVLSVGQLCDELSFCCSWQSGENPQIDERLEDHHMLHRQLRFSRRGHKAKSDSITGYTSTRARPRRHQVEETLSKLEPFSEGVIDDDAALIRQIPSAFTEARSGPLAGATPLSVVPDAGRREGGEETVAPKPQTSSVLGKKNANDSKPKADHDLFMHFLEDPNCEICRGDWTARARRKNRRPRRADGLSPPTTLGDLITANHKILNLDDSSRNDHRNAVIVRDGYSYWLRLRNKKRRTRNSLWIAEILPSFHKP